AGRGVGAPRARVRIRCPVRGDRPYPRSRSRDRGRTAGSRTRSRDCDPRRPRCDLSRRAPKAGARSVGEAHARASRPPAPTQNRHSTFTVGTTLARSPEPFTGTSAFADSSAVSRKRQRSPTDASTESLRSIWKKNGTRIGSAGALSSWRPRKTMGTARRSAFRAARSSNSRPAALRRRQAAQLDHVALAFRLAVALGGEREPPQPRTAPLAPQPNY